MATKVKLKQYVNSTFLQKVTMVDSKGDVYTPNEDTDKLVFHICEKFTDDEPLLEKEIDLSTGELRIDYDEWSDFPRNSSREWIYGEYYYDIHWESVTEDGYTIHEPLQIGKFILLNKVMDGDEEDGD